MKTKAPPPTDWLEFARFPYKVVFTADKPPLLIIDCHYLDSSISFQFDDLADTELAALRFGGENARDICKSRVRSTVEADARLQETRPIWEAVQLHLTEFQAETQKEFRQIQRQFDRLPGEISRQRAIIDDHEAGFQKLED